MSDGKKNAILSSAVLLFMLSLLNKGLGFVKSVTIASVFGATLQTDAYYVAEGLMQNVLIPISDAVAASFLPLYVGIKERDQKDSKVFASRTMADIFLLSIAMSAGLYLAAPVILKVVLPSYRPEEVRLAVFYFRILIWGMCFYMSNYLLQSLLNAEKEYGFSSFAAMLNNLILTAVVVLIGYRFGVGALAAATLFSYVVQYVFLQTKSRRYARLTLQYGLRDSRIIKLCVQAFPIFFGSAIWELNQLVDRSLLSRMEEGSVTAVSYAAVLYQFASNLIGIPLSTIIYTELAESFAIGNNEEGIGKLEKGLHISLLFCVPLSFFVVLAANNIVQITYGRGAFDIQAVSMAAEGLRYYGLCFLAYCFNTLLSRACYSMKDTILPMRIGIVSVCLNIVLSISLSRVLGLRGIVLATAIATSLMSLITLIIFNRTKAKIHLRLLVIPTGKIAAASVIATVVCALWIRAGLTGGVLLFVTSALIQFGIYGLLMVLWKNEIVVEIILLLREFIKRKIGSR